MTVAGGRHVFLHLESEVSDAFVCLLFVIYVLKRVEMQANVGYC